MLLGKLGMQQEWGLGASRGKEEVFLGEHWVMPTCSWALSGHQG